ncbi:MAG: SWIM zinc finger family protein [Anaerolineae bacterium]|nr:SWIM zinc finger family protein [Anaerolineae bacterium]
MNNSLPPISEYDIRELTTASSFERGMGYFVRGAIQNPVREGNVLRAECGGSMAINYRLRIEFDETGIAETWCSCPYSYGGICKHLVALLLTWVREPERFAVYDDLVTMLETRSKETLVALIVEMAQQVPALHELVDRYRAQPADAPPPPAPRPHRVSAAAYSSEISYIVGEGADWYHMGDLTDGLNTVRRTAEGFAQHGEFTNAAIVYTELLRGCVEGIENCDDSSGGMGFLGQECAEALQKIVPQTDWDESERQSWLRDMFELCVNDMGGYGFEDDLRKMIVATYRPADVETLESWIHEALDKHKGEWKQRGLITMLLELYEREGRDEDYLTLCAEQARRLALCEKLVALGVSRTWGALCGSSRFPATRPGR